MSKNDNSFEAQILAFYGYKQIMNDLLDWDLIEDTNRLDDKIDKKKLRPLTYGELFFISIYDTIGNLPSLIDRHPTAGQGSIYLTRQIVKTTTVTRKVSLYNGFEDTTPIDISGYPVPNGNWINSLTPHYSHLDGLNADFDGDKGGLFILLTDEAVKEGNEKMKKISNYVTPDGAVINSIVSPLAEDVLKTICKR